MPQASFLTTTCSPGEIEHKRVRAAGENQRKTERKIVRQLLPQMELLPQMGRRNHHYFLPLAYTLAA